MKKIVKNILDNKSHTVPILSFPSASLLGITVSELISSSDMQAKGMLAIRNRCSIGASLNMMDLSVEAEAFGARIHFTDNEIPTVEEGIIDDIADAYEIKIPQIGEARTSIYIEGVKKAKELITDIPVFCGVIGPYSLAGRLFDMTELMMSCYDDPEAVHALLSKTSDFLIEYIKAFKDAGADGVIMAEPAAGLLSPALAEEFSAEYVKKIFEAVDSEDFILCYHNCGDAVVRMAEVIASQNADIYHFGNSISLKDILPLMPRDIIVMGNVDPLLFRNGNIDDITSAVEKAYNECSRYDNFMLSSGCDIPFDSKWENLDAYFDVITRLYSKS